MAVMRRTLLRSYFNLCVASIITIVILWVSWHHSLNNKKYVAVRQSNKELISVLGRKNVQNVSQSVDTYVQTLEQQIGGIIKISTSSSQQAANDVDKEAHTSNITRESNITTEKQGTVNIVRDKTRTNKVSEKESHNANTAKEISETANIFEEESNNVNIAKEIFQTANIAENDSHNANIAKDASQTVNSDEEKPQMANKTGDKLQTDYIVDEVNESDKVVETDSINKPLEVIPDYQMEKAIINPIKAVYITNPTHICDMEPSYMTLLILVVTAPDNRAQRDAIRNTYGSYAKKPMKLQKNLTVHIRLAFLFGKNEDATVNDEQSRREEYEMHKDVIYADFNDTYRGLTDKVRIGLKWASLYCKGVDFLLKIDDDVIVHMQRLVYALNKLPVDSSGTIYGFVFYKSKTRRNGKWGVSIDEYSHRYYPPYVSGVAYVISGNIIARIVDVTQNMTPFPMEDVFITGFAAKAIGAKHVHEPGFMLFEDSYSACVFVRKRNIVLHVSWKDVRLFYSFLGTIKNYKKACPRL